MCLEQEILATKISVLYNSKLVHFIIILIVLLLFLIYIANMGIMHMRETSQIIHGINQLVAKLNKFSHHTT